MWKKIHVKLEFLRLKFYCLLSQRCAASSSLVLLSFSPWFFFVRSAFSSPWLFLRFLDLVLLLLLPLFYFIFRCISGSSSSSSSSSSLLCFSRTRVFKTRVPCGKNISMSAIKTRVFKAQFFRRTWASQAWDVILLISFQFLLTNYIVWQTNAILQITSK